jgi:peptide subunit release factor 1 (eRF1)
MISRDTLRQLAVIESKSGQAVSFFYQPPVARDRAHREEQILIKDLVREASESLEKQGRRNNDHGLRADLDRIATVGNQLRGNGAHSKAIFACAEQGIWREFNLPAQLSETRLEVNSHFHLKPLVELLSRAPRTCVAIIDREHALIFESSLGELSESEKIVNPQPRRARSDGFHGYDAGHNERHVDNEAMRHFKEVADRLLVRFETGHFDYLAIGCRDELWSEIYPQLHSYLAQRLVGRFSADAASADQQQILDHVDRLIAEREANDRQGLTREVLGEAQRDALGAVGLRNVLRSLEKGEAQILLMGHNFSAQACECSNCGHMDTRVSKTCGVCGQDAVEVKEIADSLVRQAILRGVSIVFISDDPDFDRVGNVGALLRFRADQNTAEKKMAG